MPPTTDHRRATAERNVEKILDAAADLLAQGQSPSTSAVAAAAGVSRPTLYAHFPTRDALLEAVAERVVAGAVSLLAGARLDEGDPRDALDRLVTIGWEHRTLGRSGAIARTVGHELSAGAMARSHDALRDPVRALAQRGQAAGAFRADVPATWLVATYFALMHACGDEVRAGLLDPGAALGVLIPTIRGAFAPTPPA